MHLDRDWGRHSNRGAATLQRLTAGDVEAIRQGAVLGDSPAALAERFGVCRSHVLAVIRGSRHGRVK